ncbi:hypothetical protein Pcinc_019042 [Petrolisthes cinctipes]|uniref:G-protein coupled receptors family 2 profile 2 domain-containing protein n=1 Tax=Petrolisthes cinctipes TaxID=88211 RepID=A0AAE1FKX1_PETCI|nr:hypothetical protein Pcinc_019042 [Petrolisthes cinctipes]
MRMPHHSTKFVSIKNDSKNIKAHLYKTDGGPSSKRPTCVQLFTHFGFPSSSPSSQLSFPLSFVSPQCPLITLPLSLVSPQCPLITLPLSLVSPQCPLITLPLSLVSPQCPLITLPLSLVSPQCPLITLPLSLVSPQCPLSLVSPQCPLSLVSPQCPLLTLPLSLVSPQCPLLTLPLSLISPQCPFLTVPLALVSPQDNGDGDNSEEDGGGGRGGDVSESYEGRSDGDDQNSNPSSHNLTGSSKVYGFGTPSQLESSTVKNKEAASPDSHSLLHVPQTLSEEEQTRYRVKKVPKVEHNSVRRTEDSTVAITLPFLYKISTSGPLVKLKSDGDSQPFTSSLPHHTMRQVTTHNGETDRESNYNVGELVVPGRRNIAIEIESDEKYVAREFKTDNREVSGEFKRVKREVSVEFKAQKEFKVPEKYTSVETKETTIFEAIKGDPSGEIGAVSGKEGSSAGSAPPSGHLGSFVREARSSGAGGSCLVHPSCSGVQPSSPPHMEGSRYSCYCDHLCHMMGDCCSYHHQPPHQTTTIPSQHHHTTPPPILTHQTTTPPSQPIIPPSHRSRQPSRPTVLPSLLACHTISSSTDFTHSRVMVVGRCPEGTPNTLASRCSRQLETTKSYTYLLDLPVFSATSGLGYTNVYCAICHGDTHLHNITKIVSCNINITSVSQLANMTYHPGELMWLGLKMDAADEGNDSLNFSGKGEQEEPGECRIKINIPDDVGRGCESDVVSSCPDNSTAEENITCSSHTHYVQGKNTVYKNRECALCHGEPESLIGCLGKLLLAAGRKRYQPASLLNLFIVDGDCTENQVWDVLYLRCEDVFCGSLFTLRDGVCVRNNNTFNEYEGKSYLNNSCYTWDYKREFSVMFPNKSIYLNHTHLIYDFGEYEFNASRITVCRPEGKWTPIMSIMSSVLISISLVCLALHMAIFFALPKRRNIPSMNLFSLTLSLFATEFTFAGFFNFNSNYVGCVIIGIVLYYFLSCAFLWMNVMSIDICRTFHSQTYKIKSRRVFIQYSIYAWSVPLFGAIVAGIVDQLSPADSFFTPQFGTSVCWFNNAWGLFVFFTFPSGLVILANMIFYGRSVFSIYKQMKSGEMASSTVRRNNSFDKNKGKTEKERDRFLKYSLTKKNGDYSSSPRCAERIRERIQRRLHAQKKQQVRLLLYCKLALTMGLTWVFAFVSMHTRSIICEYLFLVFNGLQGTFIFICFDMKKKVWEELRWEIGKRFNMSVASGSFGSSSSTTKTNLTTMSSQTSYKYRWSSTRLQDGSYRYSAASQGHSEIRSSQEREISGV